MPKSFGRRFVRRQVLVAAALATTAFAFSAVAQPGNPIKVGFSVSLTGGSAPLGKQILAGLQIWRDDVNAKGGLLGRPIELVYYDDQTTPANVPAIYTKLTTVDKVDLVVGPYGTSLIAAALPTIIQRNRLTIGILGFAVNKEFQYPRYFSMQSIGSELRGLADGYFDLAAQQQPRPVRAALLGVDAEFGKNAIEGARQNAKRLGFEIVYERFYPPATTDFTPVLRAVQAVKPDVVFAASLVPDSGGIVRAASEINLDVKMFGGALLGLLATPIKSQLGSLINGIVSYELYAPSGRLAFEGTRELVEKYQKLAPTLGTDPVGHSFPPYAYAAGQVLAQAVEATKSLDQDALAKFMRANSFQTVMGEVRFGQDGEWVKPRTIFVQFKNVANNDPQQFRDLSKQTVLWPAEFAEGKLIYPYAAAKK